MPLATDNANSIPAAAAQEDFDVFVDRFHYSHWELLPAVVQDAPDASAAYLQASGTAAIADTGVGPSSV